VTSLGLQQNDQQFTQQHMKQQSFKHSVQNHCRGFFMMTGFSGGARGSSGATST
jgi:hypothetical protein